MNITNLIEKLKNFNGEWLRVNDELCIHCFIEDYYVILCKYQRDDKSTIRVDVDDIEKEEYDIIKNDFDQYSTEYDFLNPIYEQAKLNAKPAFRKPAVA